MSIFKCKMCGGTIEFEQGASVGVCDSCGTKQTLPRLDSDRKANLYDRANHFRRNNEFDKAAGIYEQILTEDNSDAEAYWSLVLCRYGIEYVEDPATHRRVPTVNRTQFTSVFDDDNYKSAIRCADIYQRGIYEEEAKAINDIQKGILAISQNEEPFDVFICYKETDASGRRTPDSVLATDLYHQLTQEGFKVFFARITLEDKLGTAYEPYIFAALNSAKVMVVLGTKPEHFNAVWVKNEWSRYLALVKQGGGKKVLIPAYRDMDPYDLPEEFSHLQAQDMSKLGFMQDLIRGIKKIAKADEPKQTVIKETVTVQNDSGNMSAILDRGFLALEDGEWDKADGFFEQALNYDAKNARAYLGKLMAEQRVRRQEDLADRERPFDGSSNYQKALRFADASLAATLKGYIEHINERNENARLTGIYNSAMSAMNAANTESAYKAAAETFKTIPGFKDADALAGQCIERANVFRYNSAVSAMNAAKTESAFKAAAETFKTISGFQDADSLFEQCLDKAEQAKKKTLAVARALKTCLKSKSGPTLEEKLAATKTRVGNLEHILSVFGATQSQIQALQRELNEVSSQEKHLSDQRSSLGIFAGKEKKRIDESLTALSGKRQDLTEQISQQLNIINRYLSVDDVERDLSEARNIVADLEAQIESARANNNGEYSFEEALRIYYNEAGIATEVNKLYPAATFIPAIQGKSNTIRFGRYIQQNNKQPEQIEWLVLARESKKALVISKYALDCQQYNTSDTSVTWETCSLRKWLNGTFISNAFSSDEQNMIQSTTVTADKNPSYSTSPGNNTNDKVFLLSITEVNKYFSFDSARQCSATAYAKAQGAYTNPFGNCWWWLRSPGYYSAGAASVNTSGSVNDYGYSVLFDYIAVRPALWIDLGS